MSTLVLVIVIVILLGGLGYGGGLYGGGGNRYWAQQRNLDTASVVLSAPVIVALMLLRVIASPFHTGVTSAPG
jgi:hypothetical protein